jgi:hypothetical protein
LKNYVNVASKSHWQKNVEKNNFLVANSHLEGHWGK